MILLWKLRIVHWNLGLARGVRLSTAEPGGTNFSILRVVFIWATRATSETRQRQNIAKMTGTPTIDGAEFFVAKCHDINAFSNLAQERLRNSVQ